MLTAGTRVQEDLDEDDLLAELEGLEQEAVLFSPPPSLFY